jgi:GntR family transcriptional repressor for pyruvate dehydrogenase complex
MPNEPSHSRLEQTIFRDLRDHIIRGDIPADQRLPAERQLAERYGANRNTVREAIRKLEQARLVTVRHGQGVTVCDFRQTATIEILAPFLEACPDPAERIAVMSDLLAARNQVVGYAVDLAVQRHQPEHERRLAELAERLRERFEAADARAVAELTQGWLEALIDAARSLPIRWLANPFLELHEGLIDRFPGLCVLEPGLPEYLHGFLEAFEVGESARCRALTHAYFERVDRLLLQRVLAIAALSPASSAPSATPSPLYARQHAREETP